ncbi:MAG TPA: hypothetical protein VFI31_14795 [Pirellulales bacterium]|nr:hypothetical protein [Pirellulales bacterium]
MAFRQGGRLGVWQIAHGAECRVLHHGRVGNRSPWLGHGGPESLAFHRGLPVLVSTAGDGARVWDAVACRELAHLGTGLTEAALFSPGGDRLYTYGRLGLQAWPIESDPSRPREVRIGPPDDIPVPIGAGGFRVNASEDGRLLAVSSHRDGHAYVLNAKRPSDGLTLADCPKIHSLAFSADGRWISAGVVDQGIKVWDAATGKLLKYFPGLRTFVTFSPDGQWLLGGGPVDYQLWRAGSWEPAEVFPRQHADYWAGPAALTRDSRLLALAANLQQAQLIDFASRRELATFPAEGVACVAALAFDPAGNRLAISGENHRIRLWDLRAVRRALHTLQLDWELADVGSDEPPSRVVPSITVEQLNFEAELLPFFAAGCDCFVQDMFPWGRNRWSNGYQLVCRGAAGNHVELEFTVGQAGYRQLALLSTRGPNAGIFQVALDGEDVGGPIDGFDGGFAPTVSLTVSRQHLDSGPHRLRCTLTGKNPKSGGHEMGIDAIRLTPVSDGRGS